MFMQVKVPLADRNALRFLWYEGEGNVVHLRMPSHLFGGVWCPSIAMFALRKTVEMNVLDDEIKQVIETGLYVDDLLQSFSSQADLEKGLNDIKAVLKLGGFNLTKIVCNDESIMKMVPGTDCTMQAAVPSKQLKALGVTWNVEKDEFQV